jgi:hypothetical protein
VLPPGAPPVIAETQSVFETHSGDSSAVNAEEKIFNPIQSDLRIFTPFNTRPQSDPVEGADCAQPETGIRSSAGLDPTTLGKDGEDPHPGMSGIENLLPGLLEQGAPPRADLAVMIARLRQFSTEELKQYRSELEAASTADPATAIELAAIAYVEHETRAGR